MTNGRPIREISVAVLSSADVVSTEIEDRRPDVITLFGELTDEQRSRLALDAWSIGLRALGNARSQAHEARLHEVGSDLIREIDQRLRSHVDQQHQTIAAVLAKFFDPSDGQVTQRLAAFVDDQGVLARVLDKYLAPQNSVLSQTLAAQVGESSPLARKLSPTDSEGLVKVLEAQLRRVMDDGHGEVVRALDPLAEDGAVARFLRSLREELEKADEDRARQLATALAALDANDEGSLISRLVRDTHHAREALLSAVNADTPDSPMAIMRASLTALLKDHTASQTDLLRQQRDRQEQFEKEVREALGRIEARRSQEQSSPRGGLDFESAVVDFVTAAVRGAPCIADATGQSAGVLSRCKKGDLVLRFTSESAFAGAAVVIEAKRDASYTVQRGLDELDTARKNRGASAGVFVMARSHASEMFPRFARYGSDVLVTWDDRDPATDTYLHAAVLLGLALVTRNRTGGDPGDLQALQDVEARIVSEIQRLEKMKGHTDTIRRSSDQLAEELRKGANALDLLLRKAKSTLRALNVELFEEAAERTSPISLSNGSLGNATAAVVGAGAGAQIEISRDEPAAAPTPTPGDPTALDPGSDDAQLG